MLDLAQIRERVSLGVPEDLTAVDLGFLAQVIDELEQGRKDAAELQRLRSREGVTFASRRSL